MIPTREQLIQLNHVENKNRQQIAKMFGVSITPVQRWFKEYNIQYVNQRLYKRPSKEELVDLHHNQKLPIAEISKKFNVAQRYCTNWFKEYNIKILKIRRLRKFNVDDTTLYNMHYVEKKSFKQMGIELNVSGRAVALWFKARGWKCKFYGVGTTSGPERDIIKFLNEHNITAKKEYLDKIEYDIVVPTHNLAIEYCGLRWHSELYQPNKLIHLNKLKIATNHNYQLLTIFEDEWLERQDICKSIILSKIKIYHYKYYARKLLLKVVDSTTAQSFYEDNHLQGRTSNVLDSWGLYDDGNLVACLSISRHPRGRSSYVLSRLCFKKYTNVVGGAARLLKIALKHYPQIITWSDNRWSTGEIYKQLGFTKHSDIRPDYSYVKRQKRFGKQSKQKRVIGCPPNVKEHEYMKSLGYSRIWDCGKVCWVINRPE